MSLDIRASAAAPRFPTPSVEFVRIELSSISNGGLFVSLTATTVDEEEAQLLDQEIASEHVASIEEALALVRAHVQFAPPQAQRGVA
jgi:hypothetical protein